MSTKWSLTLFILLSLLVIGGVLFIGRLSRGFLDPMYSVRILREYRAMNSDDLLKKVKGFHLVVDETAVSVLRERKDPGLLEILLDFLTSRSERKREMAIRDLSMYDDIRIIDPLMNIVRNKKQRGEIDDEYESALFVLSKMKHEEAWPYVVELAQADDAPKSNLEPEMLKNFEKPEGLPLLRAMETKNLNDIYKRYVQEAIQHLESIQKQESAQKGAV